MSDNEIISANLPLKLIQEISKEANNISQKGGASLLAYLGVMMGIIGLVLRYFSLPFVSRMEMPEFIIFIVIAAVFILMSVALRFYVYRISVLMVEKAEERQERIQDVIVDQSQDRKSTAQQSLSAAQQKVD